MKRVDKFAQDSYDTIVNQCRKMGSSLDWSREAFTLDEKRSYAVRTAFKKMYDDGTLVSRGYYINNKKEGDWLEKVNHTGKYKNDKKTGEWKSYNTDSTVYAKMTYDNDELHGSLFNYDSLGNVTFEEIYEKGELLSSTADTTQKIGDELPRFPGCEDQGLSQKELHHCATNKMLTYVYSNLRYPAKARENDVEGMALFRYNVDEKGNVVDVETLWGISGDIKEECLRLINNMPKWRPGYKDEKPVKARYTLPIRFKLE